MPNSVKYSFFGFLLSLCQIAFAQQTKVSAIEIYGNRKISSDAIYAYLNIKKGDSVNPENLRSQDIVLRLKQIPGVKHATINPTCCDAEGNLIIYAGIGETDSVIPRHRTPPTENVRLPVEMITSYQNFGKQLEIAVRSGQGVENDSSGYALFTAPPVLNEQNKFIGFARKSLPVLTNVLRKSRYAQHRAAAAAIIAYSLNRQAVVDNLLYAVNDQDGEVRNNATRALVVLAGYLNTRPEVNITITAKPFIGMLNSIIWSDRNKAANILMQLTQNRPPRLLAEIKERALPSIIEMARWTDRRHALASFVILGRIAGVIDEAILSANYTPEWEIEFKKMIEAP